MDHDWLLEGLSESQRAAVVSRAAPLCIVAGPGAGKTSVLSRRIAHRVAQGEAGAEHVLALTFSRKAAGELRHRLAGLGVGLPVAAGTFHAVALAQLRRWWEATGRRPPTILARRGRILASGLAVIDGEAPRPSVVKAAEAEVAWAKARLVAPEGYASAALALGRQPPIGHEQMAVVYARFEQEKRRRGIVDLDDLLSCCAEALETDAAFAAAQRWQWRHFFVDEYQDVNAAHLRLLQAWLGKRVDLCVVGDPDQAIYGWNGADPGEITAFQRRFPSAQTLTVADNFRSTPEILAAASAALASHVSPSSAVRHRHCWRDLGAAPTVTEYSDDEAEATGVTRLLRDHHAPGTPWQRHAVLARTNAQLDVVAQALDRAGVPHRLRGGRPLLERPAIQALLWAYLPTATASGSSRTAKRSPGGEDATAVPTSRATGGLARGSTAAPAGRSRGGDSRRMSIQLLMADLKMSLACPTDPGVSGTGDEDLAPVVVSELEALVTALGEFATLRPDGSVPEFISWMEAAERLDDAPEGDVVELATFHRAKGLEWDVVFVVGLEDGLVPFARRGQATVTAEERRLLYVAMTRARDELHCSWARQRRFRDQIVERTASPFLADVVHVVGQMAGQRMPVDPRRFIRSLCQDLASSAVASPGDDAVHRQDLVDELRRWRSTMARVAAVPVSAVLTDRTIDSLAGDRPMNVDALRGVSGMGRFAADRWGPALVDVVRRHSPAT